MSLINQMLKDLANRSRPAISEEAVLSGIITSLKVKSKKNKPEVFLLSILFFLLIFLIFVAIPYYFKHPHSQSMITWDLPLNSLPLTVSAFKQPLPVSEKSILTGITLEVQNDKTNLRLLLNQTVLYRISMLKSNQWLLVLENTKLQTNLPFLDTLNSAISAIETLADKNNNLMLKITLKEGVDILQLHLMNTKKFPELQIDFSMPKNNISSPKKNMAGEKETLPIKKLSLDLTIYEELENANVLLGRGKKIEAFNTLTNILKKDPEYTPARKILANLLYEQGKFDQALEILRVGLRQQPFYPAFVMLKAQILMELDKINEALNLLRKAPPTIYENPNYHALLAALYQRTEQPLMAAEIYEQLVKIQPNNAIWWLGLGIARENTGKKTEALEAYGKATNEDSLTPELRAYIESRVNHLV